MKIFKRVLLVLALLFVVAQAVRPNMTNPPINPANTMQASIRVPPEVDAILQRSCNDCHSNRTRWPWYAQITPVSWWLKTHVDEGRQKLSFDEFATYPPKKAARKMEEICELVEKGEMPLPSYLPAHPDARLSEADRRLLCSWAKTEQAGIERSARTR